MWVVRDLAGRCITLFHVPTVAVLAGKGDREALEDVLQAALRQHPLVGWLFPDTRRRARRSARLLGALLERRYLPMHTVWTTSDQAGAAVWAPPGHWRTPPSDIARILPEAGRALGPRSMQALRFLHALERQHPSLPHWYLAALGTNPPRQGGGVGAALLYPVLERCDREGVPAYLDCSTEADISFFQRQGFHVTGKLTVPAGAPVPWAMWREPAKTVRSA